jgi:FkbM family methyltransferase
MLILVKNIVFRIVGKDFSKYLKIKYAIFYLAAKFKMYESVELSLLKKFVGKCDFVIDSGANLGIYTHKFVSLVSGEGRVLAFEPLAFLCKFLDQHIKSKRVQIVPKALSDPNQNVSLWIPYIGSGLLEPATASLQETTSHSEQLTVETVKLDDQIKENVNITILPRFARINAPQVCKYADEKINKGEVNQEIGPLYIRPPDAKIPTKRTIF